MPTPPLHIQVILAMILTSLIQGLLTYLATWGLLPGLDIQSVSSGLAAALSTAIVTALSAAWAGWLVRKQKIVNAAADLPEVKKIVVDDAKVANAAPPNVTL